MMKPTAATLLALLALAGQAPRLCSGQGLAQDSTKVDKYAFPPLPQELKHADSLLVAGDSAKGLTALRMLAESKVSDIIKARAHYSIGDYYKSVESKKTLWPTRVPYIMAANEEYEKVMVDYPSDVLKPWAMYSKAMNPLHWEESEVLFKKLIANYPNTKIACQSIFGIAMLYKSLKKQDQAIVQFKELVKNYPNERQLCASSLSFIGDLTDNSEKLKYYQMIIDKYPDQEHYAMQAFARISDWYWYNTSNKKKAIEVRLEKLKKYPKSTSNPSTLQDIYYKYLDIGEGQKALQMKERLMKEYPDSRAAKSFEKR
jgi:tetratricopeptide (TPR) repeat protein